MEDRSAYLSGECSPWPSMMDLCGALRAAGLRAVQGPHSVRVQNCEHFVFQNYDGAAPGPSIDADAQSAERLLSDARLVSTALAAADVRHRFEIYGPEGELVGYVHHAWPP